MNVEENNEEILTQEREFKPTGGFEDWEDEANEEGGDDKQPDTADDFGEAKKSKFSPQILVPLGIVGVVVIIVLFIVVSGLFKKKPAEEDYSHLDEMLTPDAEETFMYTAQELQDLRDAGYTGNEIEDYQFAEIDAEYLIEEAAASRKAQYESEIVPYFEAASDEFKSLLRRTWVGMDEFEIPEGDSDTWTYIVGKFNVDYEKIGARGLQCFIKIYLEDESEGFMTLPPDRYTAIADSGNMIVELKQCIMSNNIKVIVEAKEVMVN